MLRLLYLLGIDPDTTVPDAEGRPIPITGRRENRFGTLLPNEGRF